MAAETIATVGVQTTLARSTGYAHRVGLKSQCALVNFPAKPNHFGGLKLMKASIVCPRSNNNSNGVSNGDIIVCKGSKGMTGWHDIELMVRESELDDNGVLNNGVYYCHHANFALLERIVGALYGLDFGQALVVTELSLKSKARLKEDDDFLVRVRISISDDELSFQDYIIKLPDQQPILEAKATVAYLDINDRPIPIPEEVKSKINRFIDETDAAQD